MQTTSNIRTQERAAALYLPARTCTAGAKLRIYEPREIQVKGKGTGLFHYTRAIYPGEAVKAVGYCAESCPGHPNWWEAREHFRQYLLDKRVHYCGEELGGDLKECGICGTLTRGRAFIEFWSYEEGPRWAFRLCEHHRTRADFERLFVLGEFIIVEWIPMDDGDGAKAEEVKAKEPALKRAKE